MINPGLLNQRILLEYPTSASIDVYGQSILTYASSSIWTQVTKQGGGEVNNNGYIVNTANYLFVARSNTNITEKASITYDGNIYNITFLDEVPGTGIVSISTERRNA